jgi:hypothetical protein
MIRAITNYFIPLLLPIIAGFSTKYFCDKGWLNAEIMCDQMAAPAVVLAGFSTAAFHLRFRLIDSLGKIEKKSQVVYLSDVFRRCRKNIDYCLIAFVVTTVVMVLGKFHSCFPGSALPWIASVGVTSFFHCMIKFMQILQALRNLEDFTLNRMEENAKYN